MANEPTELIDKINGLLAPGECLDGPALAACLGEVIGFVCDNFTPSTEPVALEDGVPTAGGTFTGCVSFEGDCSGASNPVTHEQLAEILASGNLNKDCIEMCPPSGVLFGPVPGPGADYSTQTGCITAVADANGFIVTGAPLPVNFATVTSLGTSIDGAPPGGMVVGTFVPNSTQVVAINAGGLIPGETYTLCYSVTGVKA